MLTKIPLNSTPPISEKNSIIADAAESWGFLRERKGLLALLGLLFAGFFSSGLIQVLMTPLVLNFASPTVLGAVMTLSGLGAMFGAVGLTMYKRPILNNAVVVLYGFMFQGALLVACGWQPNATIILSVAFLYMSIIPVVRSCREAIWLTKTPESMQGRVLALQRGIGQVALPLAAVIAGPLVDGVFEPAMQPDGALSPIFGPVIGSGPGRGAALLFVLTGLSNMLIALCGLNDPTLRNIDTLLPNVATPKKSE